MISVIIVSWNSHEDIQGLLSQLDSQQAKGKVEVILLDNGSELESQNILRSISTQFINVKKIFNGVNFGFAKACNIGVKASSGEVVLFLNPDTKVSIETVIEAAQRIANSQDYQVLGVQQTSDKGVTRTCCRPLTKWNSLLSCSGLNKVFRNILKGFEMIEWDHLESRYVGHVIGAFYVMKKSSFQMVNGFDEDFFLYYEDLDLSARVLNAGMKIYYDASLKIYHKGGGSSEKVGVRRIGLSVVSRDKMIGKHFGHIQQIVCRLSAFCMEFPLRVGNSLMKREFEVLMPITTIYWKMLWSPL